MWIELQLTEGTSERNQQAGLSPCRVRSPHPALGRPQGSAIGDTCGTQPPFRIAQGCPCAGQRQVQVQGPDTTPTPPHRCAASEGDNLHPAGGLWQPLQQKTKSEDVSTPPYLLFQRKPRCHLLLWAQAVVILPKAPVFKHIGLIPFFVLL